MKAIPSIGTFAKNSPSASSPPADAPIPATSSRGSADSSSLLIVLLSSTMYTRLHDEGCTEGEIGERALWCLAKFYRGAVIAPLRFLRPSSGDLLPLIARDPDHDDLRAGGTRLVSNLVRRAHVADHAGLEYLALAVDDVLQFPR